MLEAPLFLLVQDDRKVLLIYRGEERLCHPGETLPVDCETHQFKVRSNRRIVLTCLFFDHRRRDPQIVRKYARPLRVGAWRAEFAGCRKLSIAEFEALTAEPDGH